MTKIVAPLDPQGPFEGVNETSIKGSARTISALAAFDVEVPSYLRVAGMLIVDRSTLTLHQLADDLVTLTQTQEQKDIEPLAARVEAGPNGLFSITDEKGFATVLVDENGVFRVVELSTGGLTANAEQAESPKFALPDGTAVQGADSGVFQVTDDKGYVALEVDEEGQTNTAQLSVGGDAKIEVVSTQTGVFFTDENGLATAQVGTDGTFSITNAQIARQFRGADDKTFSEWFAYDYLMWIWYGQSWAMGIDGVPVLTTTPPANVLTFNGGPIQVETVAANPSALQSFEPGFERFLDGVPEIPDQEHGETGSIAFADHFLKLIEAENNIPRSALGVDILVTAPGKGGETIDALSDPAQAFINRVLEQISRAYDIAQSEGKTLAVAGLTWLQGTNDANDAATYPGQMEALRQIIDNMARTTNDVFGFTGIGVEQPPVKMISWQVPPTVNTDVGGARSAFGVYDRFVAGAKDFDHIHICGTPYPYPRAGANNLHYRAPGQIEIGKLFALAAKRAAIDGEDYQPLDIISLTRQGRVLTARLNPIGELEVDTSRTAPIDDFGFKVYSSGGAERSISSITMTGDTIKFLFGANVGEGAYLEAANTGVDYTPTGTWRTNIRDTAVTSTGISRYLVAGRWVVEN